MCQEQCQQSARWQSKKNAGISLVGFSTARQDHWAQFAIPASGAINALTSNRRQSFRMFLHLVLFATNRSRVVALIGTVRNKDRLVTLRWPIDRRQKPADLLFEPSVSPLNQAQAQRAPDETLPSLSTPQATHRHQAPWWHSDRRRASPRSTAHAVRRNFLRDRRRLKEVRIDRIGLCVVLLGDDRLHVEGCIAVSITYKLSRKSCSCPLSPRAMIAACASRMIVERVLRVHMERTAHP